ncbi:MAG: hypothetical protein ABFR32_08025 [Bacteroidota bacterium]
MRIYLLSILILLISCNQPEKLLLERGNNIASSKIIGKDSLYVEISNSKNIIIAKGIVYKDTLKIGKWDLFDDKGIIDKTIEYMLIQGKQYSNQVWYYNDSKEDTIYDVSNYFKFSGLKKKYNKGDTAFIEVQYKPIFTSYSELILVTGEGIEKNFSNIDEVRMDTIDAENMKFDLNIILDKHGNENIRGYLKEFYIGRKTENDPIEYHTGILYFDKSIFVNN